MEDLTERCSKSINNCNKFKEIALMMNEDYGKLKKKMDDAKVFIADYINNGKPNQKCKHELENLTVHIDDFIINKKDA